MIITKFNIVICLCLAIFCGCDRGIPEIEDDLQLIDIAGNLSRSKDDNNSNPKLDEPPKTIKKTKKGPIDSGDYRLKSGDVFEISVWGEEGMTRDLMVQPDGKISFFLIGEVIAANRTFKQLRTEIERRLAEYINSPRVTIIGKSFAGNYVSVLGAVTKPGRHIIAKNDKLLDVISQAGGLRYVEGADAGEIANLSKAYLSRNGDLIDVNFLALLENGDMSQNITVQLGDFIYIPSSGSEQVYILGEVNSPRIMPFRNKPNLIDAIAYGGGFNTKACKNSVCVIRGSLKSPMVEQIDFKDIMKGRVRNIMLNAGDIVYVPPTFITKIERISQQVIPFMNAVINSDSAVEIGRDGRWLPGGVR